MADEVVAIYRAEVEQYRKQVESLIQKDRELDAAQKQVGKTAETEFNKGGQAAQTMGSSVQSLTGQLKTMATAIGIAFTIDRVVAFAKESIKVAAAAEGVERAFKRIGSPQLLEGLRRATRGTVSDLQLMQNAVKASNFQIPLDQLASLFKFAQQRARETGESVDYLVDSIILGIGRKSPLILDNLGISAVALKEKMGGIASETATVGDVAVAVGAIAEESLSKLGDQADTSADKMAKLTTSTDNLKVALGKLIADEASGVSEFFATLANAMTLVLTENERLANELSGQSGLKILARLREEQLQLSQMEVDASNKIGKVKEAEASKILNQIDNQKELIETIQSLLDAKRSEGNEYDITTASIERALAAHKASSEAQKEEIRNVFFLTNAIKKLKEEHDAQGTSIERIKKIQQEVIPLQEELARLLGQETEATKKAREEVEKLAKAEEDRWKALEAQADDRLKKHFEVEEFISDRTARGLREQMELDLKAEVIKGANAEATAMSIGLAEDDIIAIRQASIDEQLRIEGEYRAKIQALEDEAVDATAEVEEKKRQLREQTSEDGIASFMQYAEAAQRGLSLISQAQANASAYELQVLESQLERGAITRSEYDEERKKIMREQANDAKSAAIFQGIINGIVATINAFRDGGPVLAAITAALVAVQVGIIAAEPIPAFATGVIGLQGEGTETSDSITAKLSKGESIMTAKETRMYRPILEAIRKGTLDDVIQKNYVRPAIDAAMLNGFADMGKSAMLQDRFNDMNLLRAIDRHRDSEVKELRQMNTLLGRYVRQPKRGYA